MINLKFLNKEESLSNLTLPNNSYVEDVIVGKFNIFHFGHAKMLNPNSMNHIVLVGNKNLQLREKIILKAIQYFKIPESNYKIYNHTQGYLPSIVSQLSDGNLFCINAGNDRLSDYKRQMDQANIHCMIYKENERFMSSTELIKKISTNQFDSYDRVDMPWITKEIEKEIYEQYS